MNTKVQIPNPVDILWHSCIDKDRMNETRVPENTTDGTGKEWVFSTLWQIYTIANVLLKPVATLYPHVFSVNNSP